MRIFSAAGFYILGLVGLCNLVRGSGLGGSAVVRGNIRNSLSSRCKAELDRIHIEWNSLISAYSKLGVVEGPITLKIMKNVESEKLVQHMQNWLIAKDVLCSGQDEQHIAMRWFWNDMDALNRDYARKWNKEIIYALVRNGSSELTDFLSIYAPISEFKSIYDIYVELKREHPITFAIAFKQCKFQFKELVRRAGIKNGDGDAPIVRMQKTLVYALNSWTKDYLKLIEKSENIGELKETRNRIDTEFKTQNCAKYDEDIARFHPQVVPSGDEIYQKFFDNQIKESYEDKLLQLTALSKIVASAH